jgi:hypothetical protein
VLQVHLAALTRTFEEGIEVEPRRVARIVGVLNLPLPAADCPNRGCPESPSESP